ncbi:MAG TPA: RimK family alpha-L-glutamate ligase, partial [Terriglobales bacterium]|nr:RimK family alpha-L-glutamate ligase [Terriglobales bacterium]
MVKIGLLYDQLRPDERLIIDAAKREGIDLALYDTDQLAWDVTRQEDGIELADAFLQRCMSYFRSLHVTAALEARGRVVVNSFKSASTCGNKLIASMALSRAKIPTPRTFLAFTQDASLKALEQLGYPAVLKPVVGSWGRLVAQLKDPESARAILEPREYMHPIQQVYYLQENIKRPERDIRCYVIGDQAVAAIYRNSPAGEWRTNTARGGIAENLAVTPELAEISVRAAAAVGGGA